MPRTIRENNVTASRIMEMAARHQTGEQRENKRSRKEGLGKREKKHEEYKERGKRRRQENEQENTRKGEHEQVFPQEAR